MAGSAGIPAAREASHEVFCCRRGWQCRSRQLSCATMFKVRPNLALDSFDLQILSVLRSNGRMTKVKLAELIGLSPTPCGARIERLEKAGFILGYHADVD